MLVLETNKMLQGLRLIRLDIDAYLLCISVSSGVQITGEKSPQNDVAAWDLFRLNDFTIDYHWLWTFCKKRDDLIV